MVDKRYLCLGASAVLCLIAGSMAGFSAYSTDLAGLIDVNADTVGAFGDFGVYTGFLMGKLNDVYGISICLCTSTALITFGYLFCYLMALGVIAPNLYFFCFLYFGIGQGLFGFFIVSLSTNAANFEAKQRASVLGSFMGIYALGGVLWTVVFFYVSEHLLHEFYMTLGLSTVVAGILGVVFVYKLGPLSLTDESGEGSEKPIVSEVSAFISPRHGAPGRTPVSESSMHFFMGSGDTSETEIEDDKTTEVSITGMELWKTVDFVLMFGILFFSVGPALMWKNVIGSFGDAFQMSDETVSLLIYFWAVVNAASRLGMGWVSDWAAERDPVKYPRPLWMLILTSMALISHILYFIFGPGAAWFIDIATATVYGSCFAILATMISFYFGVQHYGFNMGVATAAAAIGDVFFTTLSSIFTEESIENVFGICYGDGCFTRTFQMTCTSFSIGIMLTLALLLRDYRRNFRRHSVEIHWRL